MPPTVALLLFVLISAASRTAAQNATTTVPTLAEVITPTGVPPNEALLALFPPNIIFAQTPIAVRYSLFATISSYEVAAACDLVALSFFGTKDAISPRLCTVENEAIIRSYISFRLLSSEFPADAFSYSRFLVKAGLNPFGTSTDPDTVEGWAAITAQRLINYFKNDGWNSIGDLTRDYYRNPFEDTLGYRPRNPAHLPPEKLRFPLRWQPLQFAVDQRGYYGYQQHITPHIGRRASPLGLSKEFLSKQVDGPYTTPNKRGKLSKADDKKARKLIDNLLKATQGLSDHRVALIGFWDNKFFSLANFVTYYSNAYNLTGLLRERIFLGDMIATYDSMLLAWKEKLRNDLVRPTTLIRRLLKGKTVRAYISFDESDGSVKVEEWEPVIPVQPHSEFPSASAVLCTGAMEHLQLVMDEQFGVNASLVPYEQMLIPGQNPLSPLRGPLKVRFESIEMAVRSCGVSRLWAGLHFRPSVDAGRELAGGTGRAAYEHMKDLYEGKVPRNCARCLNALRR